MDPPAGAPTPHPPDRRPRRRVLAAISLLGALFALGAGILTAVPPEASAPDAPRPRSIEDIDPDALLGTTKSVRFSLPAEGDAQGQAAP